MLSYMLPVEEKTTSRNLNLNLNDNNDNSDDASNILMNSERSSVLKTTTTIDHESKRPQFSVNNTKAQYDKNAAKTTVTTTGSILISGTMNADDSKKLK